MKKNDDRAFGWEWLAMLVMAVVVYACASRGYPEGGPKDTTPPQVILEEPASFTKNFDKKRVNIYFDEFVQLKDINEKFIISPPQKKKPKPRLKGKYVQVEFVDSLNRIPLIPWILQMLYPIITREILWDFIAMYFLPGMKSIRWN